MKKFETILLIIILIGAFMVRLYRFNNPIADWHSWRQSDTSAVSRNFVSRGFDILHPRFDDLSNIASGIDNPKGYRFVEFPVYNIVQAGLFKFIGFFTIEEWGRLVTIFSTELIILFLYNLVKKYTDTAVALGTAFFYAFLPFTIYYGRTVLPDTSMIMASLGGIYYFDMWIEGNVKTKNKNEKRYSKTKKYFFYILSIWFIALALLLKPYAIFFTLPLFYLAWRKFGWGMFKRFDLWVFLIAALIPIIWWRWWISHYPEGVPVSNWLFNGGNIRFRPAYFRWIFGIRLSQLILGFAGIILFLGGIFINVKSERLFAYLKGQSLFFFSFLVSSLLYVIVLARGNVQHDYYQILIIPSIVIFLGLGTKFFLSSPYINHKLGMVIFILCTVFGLGYSWYQVRDYFNINNPQIVVTGKAVDRLTPKNAKVIAPLDGDTTFLYQTKRQGWPSFEHSLPDLIKLGADYLVLANPKEQDYNIGKQYKIVSATKDYILFDLHRKP